MNGADAMTIAERAGCYAVTVNGREICTVVAGGEAGQGGETRMAYRIDLGGVVLESDSPEGVLDAIRVLTRGKAYQLILRPHGEAQSSGAKGASSTGRHRG